MTRKQFLGFPALALAAAPLRAQEDVRARRWREDLQFLVAELLRLHPDPFFRSSREDFERAVADLNDRIPELTDSEVVVAFSRLLAMLRDGHTNVIKFPLVSGLRQYPLQLKWFPEGLCAVRAPATALDALGLRLRAVAGISVDEVWDRARAVVSADNEWTFRDRLPAVLTSPEALYALRIIPQVGSAQYSFEGPNGQGVDVTIPISTNIVCDWPRFARPVRMLFEQNPALNFWFDYLESKRALYIKYNACVDDPLLPMSEFARQIGAFVRQQRVERIIVDVRNNGGGNNALIQPILFEIGSAINNGFIPSTVAGFCIIGRQTFSSGMWNAIDLKQMGVTLLGEPTGGKPNAPGNVTNVQLPNSRISVNVSTRMWSRFPEVGDAESLMPDIAVDFSLEDYARQRDPFLEKALE
ncbi:MAG: hypothetical protein HZB13_15590 [Acidobacteria bacterium]|nr:hypothetical protein [Acidobacteriota bacterium]